MMASNLLFIVVKTDESIFDRERVDASAWPQNQKFQSLPLVGLLQVLALSKSFVAYFIVLNVVTSNGIECPSSMIGMTSLPSA